MDVSATLRTLSERTQWTQGRKIIVLAGLSAGQGWERTLDRYDGEDVEEDKAAALESGLIQHILVGDKGLRLYELTAQQIAALRAYARGLAIPNSAASQAFPNFVWPTPAPGNAPELVARYDDPDGIHLVYSSVREYEVREPVNMNDLSAGVKAALGDFTQLVGVKTVKRQVFDVLWIPPGGKIVVAAADAPKGMPIDFVSSAHSALRRVVRDSGAGYLEPLNLFPAVENLYRSTWGRVVQMGFITDSGSVKHERMRLSGDCLRAEPFHKGGKAAVKDAFTPFFLAIQWDAGDLDEIDWSPELVLHGSSQLAHQAVPVLRDASLVGGIVIEDLETALDKLAAAV